MASSKCRVMFLILTLLVNALDFVSDWLFYVSAEKVEKGLVYGPIASTQVTALLVFSVIGSVGFLIEIGVFIAELRKGNDHHGDLLLDIISTIIIWVEDVPQVIISFSIALCREEAVSIFQLTKAGLVLVGVVINITATLIRMCRTYDSKSKFCGVKLFLLMGVVMEGAFAATIFCLTHLEPDTNGEVSFRVPTAVMEEHLSDQKYLTGVNLFLHHGDLFDAWNLDANKKEAAVNWLRLFSIYDLKDSKQAKFKFSYMHITGQIFTLVIWTAVKSILSPAKSRWAITECYSVNQKTAEVGSLPTSNCENNNNTTETFFVNFRFEDPDTGFFYRRRFFGEIFFNMKVLKDDVCTDANFDRPVTNYSAHYYPLTFHYFRLNEINETYVNDVTHVYRRDDLNVTRFYNKFSDLTDVTSVWRTGWNECPTTGSQSPVLDRSMVVACE